MTSIPGSAYDLFDNRETALKSETTLKRSSGYALVEADERALRAALN
jgi:hypothetical protein